jgi:hypothetical protein
MSGGRLEKTNENFSFNCYEDFGLFKEELNRKLQEDNLDDIFLNGFFINNFLKKNNLLLTLFFKKKRKR